MSDKKITVSTAALNEILDKRDGQRDRARAAAAKWKALAREYQLADKMTMKAFREARADLDAAQAREGEQERIALLRLSALRMIDPIQPLAQGEMVNGMLMELRCQFCGHLDSYPRGRGEAHFGGCIYLAACATDRDRNLATRAERRGR